MPARARAILEESVDHLVLAEVPGTASGALRAVRRQGGGEEA